MYTDILVLAFVALCVYGASFVKPLKSEFNSEYLSAQTGTINRGIFALVVVLHHLSQKVSAGVLLDEFGNFGIYAVSIFFFYSGYGLQKSCLAKPNYDQGFLVKRLSSVLLPYVIFMLLYWLLYAAEGRVYSLSDICQGFSTGSPLVQNSWYIICILCFYLAFYCFMKLSKKKPLVMILCAIVYQCLYVWLCTKLEFGMWWYNTSHILVLGMIVAKFEKQITNCLKAIYPCVLLVSVICFAYSYLGLPGIYDMLPVERPFLFTQQLSTICFTVMVFCVLLKLKLGNVTLAFLGKISLELYLIHGLFMSLFASNICYIESNTFYCVAVLICSIAAAVLLNKLDGMLIKKFNQVLHRNASK